jgi:hypothetical protein
MYKIQDYVKKNRFLAIGMIKFVDRKEIFKKMEEIYIEVLITIIYLFRG